MRNNQPVTDSEYVIREDQNLISRTDSKGRITYASPTFCEVSGYSRDELIGSPHNLIRHPDMPEIAFANLWETLEAGEVWSGLVKNRRKNGDFYWVHANVVPIVEAGEVKGYTSVRVKPRDADKARAEAAYVRIREGRARGIGLNRGRLVHTGLVGALQRLSLNALQGRLLATLLMAVAGLMLAGLLVWQWRLLIALAVAGLVVSVWRRHAAAVSRTREFAMQVAAGNLAASPPPVGRDGFGEVVDAMAIMQRSLANISVDIHAILATVSRETAELERDNRNLASHTQQQSDSLQQTAASMEELTTTVQQNAANTEQAESEADKVRRAVGESDEVVRQLVASMQQIAASAGKMTQAIEAIEGLAFQTNLLALNASVEAARAGVHGRGFAVVAQEVRRLAESSADSAEHVRRLIDTTLEDVGVGEQRIASLETHNRGVVEAVGGIDTLIREIATASREQAIGLEQINQAVVGMDSSTRQNAERVSHSASLGTLLAEQVEQLSVAISALRQAGEGKEWVSREQRFQAQRARKTPAEQVEAVPAEVESLPVGAL
ncbi:methyl-accepting chemotaxis protein [Halomonas sp. NO4]|uniref:methyl-accepting chemotaxis protein n=1 Tax=Halomonas sp. NO4 TaxID=2484813 RepID=UPI0013D7CC03|nr:methyl-accepting chemotaxis protein [Halomonas sp. NO4]